MGGESGTSRPHQLFQNPALDEDVVMVQEVPGKADPGCGRKN